MGLPNLRLAGLLLAQAKNSGVNHFVGNGGLSPILHANSGSWFITRLKQLLI
jgi:hypothetical protein